MSGDGELLRGNSAGLQGFLAKLTQQDSCPRQARWSEYPGNGGRERSLIRYGGADSEQTDLIGLPWWLGGKESACRVADVGSVPGLGRAPAEENGYPLHFSCLEHSKGGGAWWATVHEVWKTKTRLSS